MKMQCSANATGWSMQEHLLQEVPKQTTFGHSMLTKYKGKEIRGPGTRMAFISVRSTLGRLWTNITKMVSKVLKILVGLYKKNLKHRLMGTCRRKEKNHVDHCLRTNHVGSFLRQGGHYRVRCSLVPTMGCFACKLGCLN